VLHAAVDLGAGSGRVVVGSLAAGSGAGLEVVHRFANEPSEVEGWLRWDVEGLFREVVRGLELAASAGGGERLASVGVDTWGVDYALLDGDGALVERPVCYRDQRTAGMMDEVFTEVPRPEIYRRTGIQFLPFNTLYQLRAHGRDGRWPGGRVRTLLLLPDLFHYWLSGRLVCEYTNATTTQLVAVRDRAWDPRLLAATGVPALGQVLAPLVPPGTNLGPALPAFDARLGGRGPRQVIAPATHDTGSAVVGTPLEAGWAYISSGTWSLVGIETPAPIVDASSERAGFTNEGGAAGTYRFLKNVMGLWILEGCRRSWEAAGDRRWTHEALADALAARPSPGDRVIDPDDLRFLAPRDMAAEVRGYLRETGQPDSADPLVLAQVVLESLALRYAAVVGQIETITGRPIAGLQIIGGGSQNVFLNQATASAARRPVRAGPVEATALGNLAVQSIATGAVPDIAAARACIAASTSATSHVPRDEGRWDELKRTFARLT
jgi:rhamnulokinase